MKRLMTALALMTTGSILCFGQISSPPKTCIGIDIISGICFGTARLNIGHGFSQNMSAWCEIGLDMRASGGNRTETIETEHRNTLDTDSNMTTTTARFRQTFCDASIHIRFWPSKTFHGTFLSAGCRIGDRDGIDFDIGAGYRISIWKGLGAEFMYNLGIMETYRNKSLSAERLRAGICYVF